MVTASSASRKNELATVSSESFYTELSGSGAEGGAGGKESSLYADGGVYVD